MKTVVICVACLLGAGAIFYFYKRGHKIRLKASDIANKKAENITAEIIDGELKMTDVVAWFKGLSLKKDEDIPFIANAKLGEFKNLFKDIEFDDTKEAIFFGVFNQERHEITNANLIQATSIDNQLKDVLGNESLVILN
ncbi:MAG: hypothetical protein IJJ78_09235 [Paludibacteraceae bacterium]|nr:hypothetical protein [Bacteroidales bacterium]MBR0499246.1 hypothetical protein [Paludibacteraceae bacterium]